MLLHFLLFVFSVKISLTSDVFRILSEFQFCRNTNEMLVLQENCTDLSTYKAIQCLLYKSSLKIYSKFNDEFIEIDFYDKKMIVYILAGKIYKSECEPVKEIEIFKKVSNCTRDIYISFVSHGHQKNGYLAQNSIIRETNDLVQCVNHLVFFDIFNDIQIIKYENMVHSKVIYRQQTAALISDQEIGFLMKFYEKLGVKEFFILFGGLFILKISGVIFQLRKSSQKKKDLLKYMKNYFIPKVEITR